MDKLVLIVSLLLTSTTWAEDKGASLAEYQPELSPEFVGLLKAGDPVVGERLFMRKCSSCHDHLKQGGHGKGPHLWNIIPRQAGSMEGFEFSPAMKESGHVWTYATLNYYLTRTERAVPGRTMEFRGIRKDSDRADLLKFMQSLHDEPPEIPGV